MNEIIAEGGLGEINGFEKSKGIKLAVKKFRIVTEKRGNDYLISKNELFCEKEAKSNPTEKNIAILFAIIVIGAFIVKLVLRLWATN